ncbi:hypothetical protein [Streptomyces chryseus]|uniref:hypothetical protein n=1 Tax=Streptomyces chryseus TaxID=68186 RepID=UPI00110FA200|nr:hypothetical protein [Streptomyces chryseus]
MKSLTVIIAVLVSVIVGIVAGVISWADEHSIPAALQSGGVAFATAVVVCLTILTSTGAL